MTDVVMPVSSGRKSKKEIRKTLQEKLTVTLIDYKSLIGDKKFDNRIRKAARLFGSDILKALPKKPKKVKKTKEETPEAPLAY